MGLSLIYAYKETVEETVLRIFAQTKFKEPPQSRKNTLTSFTRLIEEG
jgi:hypothetical protein